MSGTDGSHSSHSGSGDGSAHSTNNAHSHKEFLEALIRRHLQAQDQVVKYKTQEVKRLISAAHEALKLDETLIELKDYTGEVYIVGDVYGHYKCVWALLRMIGFPPGPHRRVVFLGNYATRGNRGVETILLLMLLKAAWPEYVILLRGNHECDQLGLMFGLNKLWDSKFKEGDLETSWTTLCTQVFDWLPLACVVNSRVFCCHGGISRQLTSANSITAIARVQRPLDVPQSGLVADLLWACPQAENGWADDENKLTQKFGPDIVGEFLTNNNLQLLVRGMQINQKGYLFFPNEKVLTLFSAVNWCGDFDNSAGMLKIVGRGNAHGVNLQIMTYRIGKEQEASTLLLSDTDTEN